MLLRLYGIYLIPGTIMHKMALLTASSIESYLPRRKSNYSKKLEIFSESLKHRVCFTIRIVIRNGYCYAPSVFQQLLLKECCGEIKAHTIFFTSRYKLVPILLLLLIRSPQNFLFVLSHAYNRCAGQTNEQVIYHMFFLFQFSLKEM